MRPIRDFLGRLLSLSLDSPSPDASGTSSLLLVAENCDEWTHDYMAWASLDDDNRSIFCHDLVVIVPAVNSGAQQTALLQRLVQSIGTVSTPNCVVWIANEYLQREIAVELGLGEPIRTTGVLPQGLHSVVSRLSFQPERICFAIRPISWSSVSLASAEVPRSRTRFTVAVSSADSRWLLMPPPQSYPVLIAAIQRWRTLSRYSVVALIAMTLFLLVAGALWYQEARDELQNGMVAVSEIRLPEKLPLPDFDKPRYEWTTPLAYRMANRIKGRVSELQGLLEDARTLPLPSADQRVDPELVFELALMAGDFAAAYAIVQDTDFSQQSAYEWLDALTQSTWFEAVESLNVFDFTKAEVYTRLYVTMGDYIAARAPDGAYTDHGTNRTYAQILLREIESGRIHALCRNPSSARVFGSALQGPWSTRLPPEYLVSYYRRQNCSDTEEIPAILYDHLRALRQVQEESDYQTSPVCQFAMIECKFNVLTGYVYSRRSAKQVQQILDFAASCSYLSDDLLGMFITNLRSRDRADKGASPPLSWSSLDSMLACLEKKDSDYLPTIQEEMSLLPCDWISGVADEQDASARSASALLLQRRCSNVDN